MTQDPRNLLQQCPLCRKDTFKGDYGHEIYIKDGKLVCTGGL